MKEFSEAETSVSMNRQVGLCGGEKFMLDAIVNGQPVKLCGNARNVLSFLEQSRPTSARLENNPPNQLNVQKTPFLAAVRKSFA